MRHRRHAILGGSLGIPGISHASNFQRTSSESEQKHATPDLQHEPQTSDPQILRKTKVYS
eukprot:TRINITY_DN6033_c0_g1_i1.p2 TRINITY_DN6033_c0_g1~~TRINITY_DN6033_c0_g1_i1.p2  ORF type:complete len:60 (+),score=6.33 TRINITY_DN6033_c0_g1_i1:369-548(+)